MFAEGNSKLILTFVAGSGRRGLVMKLTQVSDHDMSQARLTNNGHNFEHLENFAKIFFVPTRQRCICKLDEG